MSFILKLMHVSVCGDVEVMETAQMGRQVRDNSHYVIYRLRKKHVCILEDVGAVTCSALKNKVRPMKYAKYERLQ